MATVELNNRAQISVNFTDVATGNLVDPTTVRLKVRNPAKTITTYTHPNAQITKDGTGQYRTIILFNRPGEWLVRWQGESSNQAAEETVIQCNPSPFYDGAGVELPDG